MGLVKCPKCGGSISAHTHNCLHCGFVTNVLDGDKVACPNCGTASSKSVCKNCNYDIGEYYFEKGCDLLDLGKRAFRSVSKENESLRNLLIAAKLGQPDALNMLGICYRDGIVVKRDEERGLDCLEKAALEDCSMAEFNLACCYELGKGTKINYREALKWYIKAARHHNKDAIFNIGNFYMQGYGVNVDYEQAIEWFEKLGEYDYEAQYCAGICYLNLGLTRQNLIYAEKCFRNGARGDIEDAREKLDFVRELLRR